MIKTLNKLIIEIIYLNIIRAGWRRTLLRNNGYLGEGVF